MGLTLTPTAVEQMKSSQGWDEISFVGMLNWTLLSYLSSLSIHVLCMAAIISAHAYGPTLPYGFSFLFWGKNENQTSLWIITPRFHHKHSINMFVVFLIKRIAISFIITWWHKLTSTIKSCLGLQYLCTNKSAVHPYNLGKSCVCVWERENLRTMRHHVRWD
jgi:hypothetical protein